VAGWAEAGIVLAAGLGSGTGDPRAGWPGLLRRALASLPAAARACGRVAMRADAGYFAGALARAAHDEHIAFAIGAKADRAAAAAPGRDQPRRRKTPNANPARHPGCQPARQRRTGTSRSL